MQILPGVLVNDEAETDTEPKIAHTVYLAMGSNLGDRAANLQAALDAIASFVQVTATSHLYESPAAYVTDQPSFYNAVCRGKTHLSPEALLAALKETEVALGRVKTIRYGPRRIDLDILLYDDLHLERTDLVIPHPRMSERAFVLEPLCDLAPDLRHPVLGLTIRTLWQELDAEPLPKVCSIPDRSWPWGNF